MIMKHITMNPNGRLLIFSAIIGTLFMLGGIPDIWSKAPATAKVVFMSKRDGNAEIYIMNPNGSEQVNLTQHPAADYDPVWSPNGRQILFSSDRDGVFDLYLMDADGSNVRKVFETTKYRVDPAWSPDGKQIAYAQGDPGKAIDQFGFRFVPYADLTLYIATVNGDSVEKLTDGFQPSWSPDGRKIAFIVGGLKHTPLGIFDLRRRPHKVLLLKEAPWIFDPAWSPHNGEIVFAKLDRVFFDAQGFINFSLANLYTVDTNGNGLHQVTDETLCYKPTWSPQGNALIYAGKGGGTIQLFITDLNGNNPTQLTYEGSNSSADWFDPFYSVSPSPHSLTTTWGGMKAY